MRHLRLVCVVVTLALCSVALLSQTSSGHALFEQALAKERVEGNLLESIKLYERVVAEFTSDRPLAAQALVQVGLCYEKLGRDEAVRAYERLVRDFADQQEPAAQARSRLAALKRPAPAASPAMSVQLLPDVARDGELVAVSPDGTKAIVMDYGKGVNIAVYDFSTRQKRVLTDTWYTFFAIWSPDGRRVAYHTSPGFDASELRVTTLEGQSSVVYRNDGAQSVQPVGWTPDGMTLVVVVRRPDKTWTIGTLPVTGGLFTPVRSVGWSYDWRDGSPRLSPDGRFIAYIEGEKGLRDVHIVSLDGRDAYRITDDPADDMAPLWSPDGRRLAFISNRLGSVSLWSVEVRDGRSFGQPVRLKDGMQSTRVIDWTGRGVFFDQQTTTWDLYTAPMDPVEGRPTGTPRLIPYSRTGRNLSPVWSPDGARLAFISSSAAEPDRRYVVVMSPDGGQAREFLIPTTSFKYPQSPTDLRWFGDGRGLGFSETDSRGVAAAFRLRLDTGEWHTTPLPAGDAQVNPSIEWNRDGSAFYFKRRGFPNAGIFERAVDGETERAVYRATEWVQNIRSLEISPDRKWLAFQQWSVEDASNKPMTKRILAVDVTSGETRTFLEEPSGPGLQTANFLGWAPSGDLLVERRGTGGSGSETILVPLNGSAHRPTAIPAFASRPEETPPEIVAKWSPNGQTMVLRREGRGWETFVIENPLAAIRTPTTSR